jgi:hypothetical protein
MRKLLLLFALPIIIVCSTGCEKRDYLGFEEGYVIGTCVCYINDSSGVAITDSPKRCYCISLTNNSKAEYHGMDCYTFNFPDSLFNFPKDILDEMYDPDNCGPVFFGDEYISSFKIRFKYEILEEKDKTLFGSIGACVSQGVLFPWTEYAQIKITDIFKSE